MRPSLALVPLLLATGAVAQSTLFGPDQLITNSVDGPLSVYAVDLDGDGDVDVLSASVHDDKVAWFENLGGGAFGPQQVITTNALGAQCVHASDLDGDGDPDVLTASFDDDKIAWHENQGGGSFGPQQVIATVNSAKGAYAVDIDGDGDKDVLSASGPDSQITYYVNDGTGVFSAPFIISVPSPLAVVAGDMDNDGDADIVASISADQVLWFENLGFGFFSAQQLIAFPAYATSLFLADIDGDGLLDVLSGGGGLGYHRNAGAGAFVTTWLSYDDTRGIHAADLDGDGDPEVIGAEPWNAQRVVYYENLGGSFAAQQWVSETAPSLMDTFAADLDGDGDLDVISTSIGGDRVAWHEAHPPITSTAVSYGAGCGSPALTFTPSSTAIINSTMTGTITSTPTPLCVVAMGLSNASMPGIGTLPLDLSVIGAPGCFVYQSAEVFGLGTTLAGQPFAVNWSYPVPGNLNTAHGLHVYTQAFSYAPGANNLQIVVSNGIDWLIGDQ